MAIKNIFLGAIANDGTGDKLRVAFGLVNDNFSKVFPFNELNGDATGVSGSAYASKGMIFNLDKDITLNGVFIFIYGTAGQTVKIVIAEVNPTGNVISAILFTSSVFTATSSGIYKIGIDGLNIASGKRIAIIAVRTDGSPTSVIQIHFPASVYDEITYIRHYGAVRYASTNPLVGDSVLFATGSSVMMRLLYKVII